MNQLAPEKQKAITQGYRRGLSVRKVADIVQCSPITARTYLKLKGIKIRTISEGMKLYHALERGEPTFTLNMMLECYNLKPITNPILPCGKTRSDCVDCGNIFGEGCGFCS